MDETQTEVKPVEVKPKEKRGRPPTCLTCGYFHKADKPHKEPIKQDMIDKAKARAAKIKSEQETPINPNVV